MSNLPPLIAKLVGIDNYSNFKHLRPAAVVNANNLRTFLEQELFKGDLHDIQTYEDASRDTIIRELSSLQKTFERNKAILFFFSGVGGKSAKAGSIICPADVGKDTPGITDQELVLLFDKISRARGNNITFFLDVPSTHFEWGNPSSFVVVAPRSVSQTNHGEFTNSIIEVLRSEIELNGSIGLLTVQSFVDKLHTVMPRGTEVDCYGQNVDRLLFNPAVAAGRAHYAFISGRAETNGSFTLLAGYAHGIQKGATYGIYPSHVVIDQNKCLGHLSVLSVEDATTAKLCIPPPDFHLPPVFYAVETHCPNETVKIFIPKDVNMTAIKSPGESKGKEDESNVTMKITNGNVEFLWNGVAEAGVRVKTEPGNSFSVPKDDQELVMNAIRRAARFTYHVGSSSDSSLSPLFELEFKEVDEAKGKPNGKDLLSEGLVDLKITKNNQRRAFCLVIRNKAKFPVWPFVFLFEPIRFSIMPWYVPKKALAAQETYIVGDGEEASIKFDWHSKSKVDLAYIKIFVTQKYASFSFLQQYGSSVEDKLRELGRGTTALSDGSDGAGNAVSGTMQSESSINGPTDEKGTEWDAMRITIKRTYGPEEASDHAARDRLLFRGWRRGV